MFKNRVEAGVLLADRLKQYKENENTLVVAIPRGGIIVAYTLAQLLMLPLTAIIIKKLPSPKNPEFAIGALSEFGDIFWDEQALAFLKVSNEQKKEALEIKKREIEDQIKNLKLSDRKIRGKITILVDDGVATGATVTLAALILRKQKAKKIILATPIVEQDIKEKLQKYFDEIIALETPYTLHAVGKFYKEFGQVSDEKVSMLLKNK